MNTRGLTELVVVSIGKELGVLDGEMFSMMVLMALITTAMTGPLMDIIYPADRILRDAETSSRNCRETHPPLRAESSGESCGTEEKSLRQTRLTRLAHYMVLQGVVLGGNHDARRTKQDRPSIIHPNPPPSIQLPGQ
jgi:hypothetical protein